MFSPYIYGNGCGIKFLIKIPFLVILKLALTFTLYSNSAHSVTSYSPDTNKHFVLEGSGQFEEGFKLAWIAGPKNQGNFQVSPILINGKLFVFFPNKGLKGFNPSSGEVQCEFNYALSENFRSVGTKGDLLVIPTAGELLFFDTKKCELSENFGINGKIELRSLSLLDPAVDFKRNIIISPALSGEVEFYDFKGDFIGAVDLNGKMVQPRIWSGFNYDADLGLAYVVTSNSGFLAPYEIDSNDVDYSNSIIAIDVKSKSVKWQKQEFSPEYLDLDFVGKPMVVPCINHGTQKCIVALSKSGSIFFLDANTGDFIFDELEISNNRLKPLRPHRLGRIKYDPSEELVEFDDHELNRLNKIMKKALFAEDEYTKINEPYITFGIHGGPEWFGGSYDKSLDLLVVPTNRIPWILRTTYYPKRITKLSKFFPGHRDYQEKCALCHGKDMEGFYTDEGGGDYGNEIVHVPSLLGAKRLFNINRYRCNNHLEVHSDLKSCPSSLNNIVKYLSYVDTFLVWDNVLGFNQGFMERRFWQPLVTKKGFPASKTPWGSIYAVSLTTGNLVWRVPFGTTVLGSTGDWNMGGLVTTSNGYTIASGTRDAKARIFETGSGKLITEIQLSAPASSPPTTFTYDGCTYVALNASGGQFYKFKRQGRGVEVYVNKGCER
jgi:quinoprotein glucose dehydrogenase